MSLSSFSSLLLSTALAITSVQASPFDLSAALQSRDIVGSSCVPFVYGAKDTPGGQVCTSIFDNNLIVKYPDLSGGSYSDLHVIVQTGVVTEPNQGKWPYTLGKGQCTTSSGTASCTIPILDAWRKCSTPLYVGVHASFSLPDGSGNTGWGKGDCIADSRPSNCPKYFSFTPTCECATVTSYEPYSTSLEYVVTKTTVVYKTYTTTCTTEKSPVTATATCTNPSSAAVPTVTEKLDVAGFACTAPPS